MSGQTAYDLPGEDASSALAADARARARALEPRSFIVEAPAGAGKTELLTQRILSLLSRVEAPEEIIALTFTNKAAGEMSARLQDNLAQAARGEWPAAPHRQLTFRLAQAALERDRALGWGLMENPARLQVGTLDALAARLARQMPLMSRFGRQPGVAEEASAPYQEAARRTLDWLDESDDEAVVAPIRAALDFFDNDAARLEKLIIALLGRRDQWLRHAHRGGGDSLRAEVTAAFTALIEAELTALAACFPAALQESFLALAAEAAEHGAPVALLAQRAAPLTGRAADLAAWRALAAWLLTSKGTPRERLTVHEGFPAGKAGQVAKERMRAGLNEVAACPERVAALAAVQQLPDPALSDAEWATVAHFSALLQVAAAELWLVFQAHGEVDFIEMAARASLALGDAEAPSELAEVLDYSLRHLLIDEFQDTSPAQVRLIAQLTRGWQPDDGHTLFLVGDPMQSIYRFRKAEVGLFLRVRAEGIAGLPLEALALCRNNRSDPAVVGWVNRVFPGLFPRQDALFTGGVRYAPFVATRLPQTGAGVRFHPLPVAAGEVAEVVEARAALAIIQAFAREHPGERLAVLARAKKHLAALVAEMRQQAPDLRFQAVEVDTLADRQVVQDLLALTRALLCRGDRVNWLAILRAPWCGLTLADLHALAGDDFKSTLWQLMHDAPRCACLSADGQQRLSHVRAVLSLALGEAGRQPPRRWLEGTWHMLGGPEALAEAGESLAAEAFFDLVDTLAERREFDADRLEARAGELFAPPDPLAPDRLQLMTIHKAKGLEFEAVLLLGLHRASRKDDHPLLVWDEWPGMPGATGESGEAALLVAPQARRGEASETPTAFAALRRLERARSRHEDARVLYVAVTRAISHLHVLGVFPLEKTGQLKLPAKGTPLENLIAEFVFPEAARPVSEVSDTQPAASLPTPAPGRLWRLQAPAIPGALALPPPLAGWGESASEERAAPAEQRSELGTLVHRLLEQIALDGLAQWPVSRLPALAAPAAAWLRGQGVGRALAAAQADEALAALAATLDSPEGRWVLAEQAEAHCEWRLRSPVDGLREQVIDRSFVADGQRWIIDYKMTPALPPAELAARAESHREQLERYAQLLSGDLPRRLAIFFPAVGRLVEIPWPRPTLD